MYCSAYYTDPHDYGFLDLDPQKYADPRLKIQGAKLNKNWYTHKNKQKNNICYLFQREAAGMEPDLNIFFQGRSSFRIRSQMKSIP